MDGVTLSTVCIAQTTGKNSYRRVATSQQPVLVTSWTCVWCHECDVLDQDEGSGKERVYSVSQKNPP